MITEPVHLSTLVFGFHPAFLPLRTRYCGRLAVNGLMMSFRMRAR